MAFEGLQEASGAELGPAVGMHDHPGGPASVGHCHLERVDGDPGLHPRVDRVADDPVGEHVLDRAQVDLALAGAVLGDVGQPQRVGALGAELPVDQVVVDGRAGFLVAGLARGDRRVEAGDPAQPPDSALRECVPELGDVIGQDAVAALRVIIVELMQHGDQLTLFGLAGRDRLLEPLVVALLGESQHPTRDRHRHPDAGTRGGHLLHERVDHFGGVM